MVIDTLFKNLPGVVAYYSGSSRGPIGLLAGTIGIKGQVKVKFCLHGARLKIVETEREMDW